MVDAVLLQTRDAELNAELNAEPDAELDTELDDWVPELPPTDLIFDDGEPLETNRHRVAMNVLIRSYQHYRGGETDFYTGGNMFIYYSTTQAKNRDFRGPDFFVVLEVEGSRSRQGWITWEEEGRYPDVIIELMSASTAHIDVGAKKELYDRVFKTQDYFVYNPFKRQSLRGWHRTETYQDIQPDSRNWLWCKALGLWVGTWEGTIDRETTSWLRFYDSTGALVLLPEEAAKQQAEAETQRAEMEAQRAEMETQRANRLAQRLRELGENPDLI